MPSFHEAFNDALLSASVAAHQGELSLLTHVAKKLLATHTI